MAGVRKDIAKLAGVWSPEVEWYARAVAELRSRPMNVRTSWLYFGAIHGFDEAGWLQQGITTSATPLPVPNEMGYVFNQCQHAGWFFLPWHRGYLASFEAVIADWITSQGGPADWALPYWNYLDTGNANARNIPQEFLDATLPDGTPNPLSQATRGGVNVLGPMPQFGIPDINFDAQSIDFYTATAPGTLGYGGPVSGFVQQGNSFGGVEGNPHGPVHVMIGGLTPQFQPAGWMTDPDYAALDPIFWLHHCNIDRLWEAWMRSTANQQETSAIWTNGPFPRQFVMPNPGGGVDIFTPGETLPGGPLSPSYDDLQDGTDITLPLVAAAEPEVVMSSTSHTGSVRSKLMGANADRIEVTDTPSSSSISLEQNELEAMASESAGAAVPSKLMLNLEGIRGSVPTGVLKITLGFPTAEGGMDIAELDSVVLFGLAKASSIEGSHAGNGFTVAIDITDKVSEIQTAHQANLDALEVNVSQPEGAELPITVDRISIYRQIKD